VAADRPVLALATRGMTPTRTKADLLTLATRRKLLNAFLRNLDARCRYHGERRSLSDIVDAQARPLADVLSSAKPARYAAFHYNH